MLKPLLSLIAALSLSSAVYALDTLSVQSPNSAQSDSETTARIFSFELPAGSYQEGASFLVATFAEEIPGELEVTCNVDKEKYAITVEGNQLFLVLQCDVEVEVED